MVAHINEVPCLEAPGKKELAVVTGGYYFYSYHNVNFKFLILLNSSFMIILSYLVTSFSKQYIKYPFFLCTF
jgi:hypothetical protein